MVLPLGPAQWTGLAILAALILLDAVLAWIKNAARGTFSWGKFGLFVRKQFYVLGSAILLAVTQKYGPPSVHALLSATWWAGAIAVALQYVLGDILGDKLGILPTPAQTPAPGTVITVSGAATDTGSKQTVREPGPEPEPQPGNASPETGPGTSKEG